MWQEQHKRLNKTGTSQVSRISRLDGFQTVADTDSQIKTSVRCSFLSHVFRIRFSSIRGWICSTDAAPRLTATKYRSTRSTVSTSCVIHDGQSVDFSSVLNTSQQCFVAALKDEAF